ncbi:MAG: serine/threonine protein kinase [Myxococcaceae bacterium]|nr:serine/threonine protein kinase [Myxococcaceae bacterium]
MPRTPAQASNDQRMIGQTVAGRYSLVRLLGDGGMGAVYKAEDNILRRFVAIKLLHPAAAANPAAVERFLREAQSAASIGHPNIIDILDFGESEGKPYLVMEYLRGRSLAETLHNEGPQSIRDACTLSTHALAGLQAAHDRGILHRDLKPANMMVVMRFGDRSFVKLLDFGFAALVGASAPGDRNLTPARTLVGTPAYAPPERLRGDDRRDPRTDLYSLGVVIYEMLAGVRPFEASTFSELARKVQNEPPPSLRMFRPDVPEALERVVLKALAKKPDDRFVNAEAFASALVPFGGRAVENDDGSDDSLAMDLLKIRSRDRKREPTGQVPVPAELNDSSEIDFQKLSLDLDTTRAPEPSPSQAAAELARSKAALPPGASLFQPPPFQPARKPERDRAPSVSGPPPLARRSTPEHPTHSTPAPESARNLGLPPPPSRPTKPFAAPSSPALPRHVEAQGLAPIAGPEAPFVIPRGGVPPPLKAPAAARGGVPSEVPVERRFEGSFVLSVLRFVASRYGERALTAVLGRLQPEARAIFDAGVTPGTWLPFDAVCALVETIDATLGRDDLHIIADCGRAVAEGAFETLKRQGPPEPPPELLLAEMPGFVESLIGGITCRLRSVGRGYGRLELDEQGTTPSLTLCVLVLGFLDRCLSRFGASEVEVNLLACRYLGDEENSYDISWLVV